MAFQVLLPSLLFLAGTGGAQAIPHQLEPIHGWVLAVDAKGAVVTDLRTEEFQITENGQARPVRSLDGPLSTSQMAQSWLLLFEPIRDARYRQTAILAVAEFVALLPEGDRVLFLVRTKDHHRALTPGFSMDRALWAKALSEVDSNLAEALNSPPDPTKALSGFDASLNDKPNPTGGKALESALVKCREVAARTESSDPRGLSALQSLGLRDPSAVATSSKIAVEEMKAMGEILGILAKTAPQAQAIIFSRNEMDDFASPEFAKATRTTYTRHKGDLGGPQESAELGLRDTTLARGVLVPAVAQQGWTIHSVAGYSSLFKGNLATLAYSTGGMAITFGSNTVQVVAQGLQSFGSRYHLSWIPTVGTSEKGRVVDIKCSRPGIKLFAPTLR
jgi:hypothetical protein